MAEQHGKTLVPQIRFAGFTDPWEQHKLGDVANVCSGRDYKHLAEGPIPVYGTGGYMTSVSKALSYDEDAIGIGRKGTIDKPYRLQAPFWTVDTLFYAIPEASSDINFLLCSFLNVDWKSKDESTGLPSLSKRAINETEVLVPDNGEQRQIGAFFDRLDSLITLHQRKYDKLCVLKKSMLDKMFPKGGSLYPEIRFAGFTDPWEQRKLSDLTDRVSIQSSDSDLPQVEYEDIIPGEGTLNKDLRDKKGGKTGIKFYAGDVLYGKLRPYLMNWLYPQFNGVAVGDFWVLRATECDSSFLYRLVQTGSFQRLANVSSGSKMPRADWNLISQSFFAVPADHAEQKAIAKGLAELDTLITLHQRKYDGCANPLFLERRISCRKPSHQNRCSATTTPSG